MAAVAVVLAGSLYQFWLRDSSLVAVHEVEVSGLTTKDAANVATALTAAGEEMTTLHVDHAALEEVAAGFPAVESIVVDSDFPHGLKIQVTERPAAALVMVGDAPIPVAADGTVLTGVRPPRGLPLLESEKPQENGRLTDPRTLRALAVVGTAPTGLPQRIAGVTEESTRGIVIELKEGPEILFGDAGRAEAKWVAATRLLADVDAQGASYIDVRLPERPVAGGLPVETIEPVAPAGEPIVTPPATEVDPATGLPVDPAAAAPVDPAAAPVPAAPEAAAPAPEAAPVTPAPTVQGTPTGGVTSP